jgi:hypothetical protein
MILDNEGAAMSPKSGDYWHERYMPVCVVMEVDDNDVLLSKTTINYGKTFSFDYSKVERMTRESFVKWLSYGSIPGLWADCIPRSLVGDAEEWKEHVESFRANAVLKQDVIWFMGS